MDDCAQPGPAPILRAPSPHLPRAFPEGCTTTTPWPRPPGSGLRRAASASSNTTFIESAAGIGEGGRTGLTAVAVGGLFLLCLFISPLAAVIPPEATAPVLVIVGYFMMETVGEIHWRDPSIGIPALLTIGLMPFTYSITNGIGAGFIAYTAIKVMQGLWRDVHPLMYLVTAGFLFYFVRGLLA